MKIKTQVFNLYLILNEYIPGRELHVFGDRVYVYGFHDKEGGDNDEGRVYLYYGFAPTLHKIPGLPKDLPMPGCSVVELEDDPSKYMSTVLRMMVSASIFRKATDRYLA